MQFICTLRIFSMMGKPYGRLSGDNLLCPVCLLPFNQVDALQALQGLVCTNALADKYSGQGVHIYRLVGFINDLRNAAALDVYVE